MHTQDLGPAMEASYNQQLAKDAQKKADDLKGRVERLEAVCIKLIEEVQDLRRIVGDDR